MITRERFYALLNAIVSVRTAIPDETAAEVKALYPSWREGVDYTMGDEDTAADRVLYDNVLYKCIQNHTSRSDWTPDISVSLWTVVLIPDPEVIYDWVQPESTNPYMMGDKVRHNGKIWISTMDYNVHEPGVAGWNEVVT